MAPDSPLPKANRVLAALPDPDWERWMMHLEAVDVALGQVLHEPGESPRHAYFPAGAIVSLVHPLKNGASAAIAVVGNEGLIGVPLFMSEGSSPVRAVVHRAGRAYRLSEQVIKREFERGDAVRRVLLGYTHALMTQVAQLVACRRHHSLDQQLCRWLLSSLERSCANEPVVSQAFVTELLGVHRKLVTDAVLRLQKRGLVLYSHGRILVLEKKRLAVRTCECFEGMRAELDR